ncbi:PREDICTED: uncharacterized protein LOC106742774 [Dinoponera quadriceps]|uniref:Uncharacterized protein LOC106742774 n=1 Tax=Dinoponera quadriceps TaxID=609295 RepID=A0A6P3X012_DINQU|nr:PREDICTED: uncharacterized protein LOC106742774 [Dinoponera quadriceps]
MAAHHCFTIGVLFLGTLSTVRAISVPYEDIHLEYPTAARFIYTASEFDSDFDGYSYSTEDLNGGGSNVVFATGADSLGKLKKTMNSMYKTDAMMKTPESYMQRDKLDNTQNNTQKNPMSPGQQSKSEIEANMNKQEDFVLDTDVSDEGEKILKNPEANDSSFEHQAPQEVPFMPYPAFRANFLNLQLPVVLPRYHIPSDVIQDQYYPHSPYTDLQFPLHDFDFYNPSAPLFYQTPITANPVPINVLNHASAAVKDTTVPAKASTVESSRTTTQSANSVESNMIELKSNFESTVNQVEETSSSESTSNTVETMTASKVIDEEMTTESAKSTVKSRKCDDQIVNDKVSSTESANTKVSTSTKESSTETSAMSTNEM